MKTPFNNLPTGVGVTVRGMARNILDFAGDTPLQGIIDGRLTAGRFLETVRVELQTCDDGEPVAGLVEWLERNTPPHGDIVDALDTLFRELADMLPVKLDYHQSRTQESNQ